MKIAWCRIESHRVRTERESKYIGPWLGDGNLERRRAFFHKRDVGFIVIMPAQRVAVNHARDRHNSLPSSYQTSDKSLKPALRTHSQHWGTKWILLVLWVFPHSLLAMIAKPKLCHTGHWSESWGDWFRWLYDISHWSTNSRVPYECARGCHQGKTCQVFVVEHLSQVPEYLTQNILTFICTPEQTS